jgi:hypothetical protein
MNGQTTNRAISVFKAMAAGISNSVTAADLYIQQLLAHHHNREIDKAVVENLLSGKHISGQFFMRESLTQAGYGIIREKVKGIVDQLVVSTWSLLEVYLRNKFEELLNHRFHTSDSRLVDMVMKNLNFQGLDRIKKHYKDYLDFDLACYELEKLYITDNPVIDSKRSSWERIALIAEARHDIVHGLNKKVLGELYPSDVWNLFDFARRWVSSFDVNINMLWYEGRKSALIKEYENRLRKPEDEGK